MKEFFDTSVLVGAFWRGHPKHDASLKLVSVADKRKSACAERSGTTHRSKRGAMSRTRSNWCTLLHEKFTVGTPDRRMTSIVSG